ncbi:MAG: PIG-L deacetylase family protein [Gemmatimonadota bacterium]
MSIARLALVLTALQSVPFGRAEGQVGKPDSRTLLAVFAHPDDETTMSGTLARYAREGAKVVIVAVTSGQKGGPNPGPALGALREAELRAACKELGISPPRLLGFMDGTVATDKHAEIRARITQVIRDVRPQVIVTFGPDGVTGHADHIAVGKLTTEVFEAETARPGGPTRLYDVAIPRTKAMAMAPILAGRGLTDAEMKQLEAGAVPDASITVTVDIREFLDTKHRAAALHTSQFPQGPKYQQWLASLGSGDQEYFVQVGGGRTGSTDLFYDLLDGRRR